MTTVQCSKCPSCGSENVALAGDQEPAAAGGCFCRDCGEVFFQSSVPDVSTALAGVAAESPVHVQPQTQPQPIDIESVLRDIGPVEARFIAALDTLQEECYQVSVAHGWWENEADSNPLSKIMLVVTELAEAVEGYRKPGESSHIPGFAIQEEELADAIIRILDLAGRNKMRIALAVVAKIRYNRGRLYRHGGKRY